MTVRSLTYITLTRTFQVGSVEIICEICNAGKAKNLFPVSECWKAKRKTYNILTQHLYGNSRGKKSWNLTEFLLMAWIEANLADYILAFVAANIIEKLFFQIFITINYTS